ncbi:MULTISPECIES: GntR family transcriptional regulator [unclassified Streptomyces]|uniref:GntR family transcriptional regulator n=1 Tax=unclassified Streptomyces TaxID=2593676 RepID=UPI0027E44681|nr:MULTISPECIES: GntR family transcriptional regulator [unclassified Streptomyces]
MPARSAEANWNRGVPLPSEKELTERCGVARNTVRAAFGVLRDDGLGHTVSGRGTYVRGEQRGRVNSSSFTPFRG